MGVTIIADAEIEALRAENKALREWLEACGKALVLCDSRGTDDVKVDRGLWRIAMTALDDYEEIRYD